MLRLVVLSSLMCLHVAAEDLQSELRPTSYSIPEMVKFNASISEVNEVWRSTLSDEMILPKNYSEYMFHEVIRHFCFDPIFAGSVARPRKEADVYAYIRKIVSSLDGYLDKSNADVLMWCIQRSRYYRMTDSKRIPVFYDDIANLMEGSWGTIFEGSELSDKLGEAVLNEYVLSLGWLSEGPMVVMSDNLKEDIVSKLYEGEIGENGFAVLEKLSDFNGNKQLPFCLDRSEVDYLMKSRVMRTKLFASFFLDLDEMLPVLLSFLNGYSLDPDTLIPKEVSEIKDILIDGSGVLCSVKVSDLEERSVQIRRSKDVFLRSMELLRSRLNLLRKINDPVAKLERDVAAQEGGSVFAAYHRCLSLFSSMNKEFVLSDDELGVAMVDEFVAMGKVVLDTGLKEEAGYSFLVYDVHRRLSRFYGEIFSQDEKVLEIEGRFKERSSTGNWE